MMAGWLAIVCLLTALFAAPLALGSYAIVPRSDGRALVVWFGLLTALFGTALLAGALALLLLAL